jgi:hypothetical protein
MSIDPRSARKARSMKDEPRHADAPPETTDLERRVLAHE